MMKMTEYSCDACGGKCLAMGEGTPTMCLYSKGVQPRWMKVVRAVFDNDDPFRKPYIDDEKYIASLTDEQKNEIVRNHLDCRMSNGCPCFTDKDYKCMEWKAFCELTGSDGSDFEFDDCWFRSNEHRCLTDYVLWRIKKNEES